MPDNRAFRGFVISELGVHLFNKIISIRPNGGKMEEKLAHQVIKTYIR